MPISDIVNVQITASSPGITQAGFGVALILSATAGWTERTRTYTDIADVEDDFDTDEPEYLAAAAYFAQNPRPTSVMIGRLALLPTQKWTLVPVAVDSTNYTIYVDGTALTIASGIGATATTIVTAFKTAFNALSNGFTATGTATLIITADDPGNWIGLEVANITLMSIVQDHANPGTATDLAAIALEDDSWYGIINSYNSAAMVTAISDWAEDNEKLFIFSTHDSECATIAVGGATDILKALQTSANARTAGIYHPSSYEFADAAWFGRCLPLTPGSETWFGKTLAGVAATRLTPTWRTNILAKSGNVYETIAGRNVTEFGTVAAEEYIDVIRFRDWLKARISERVFSTLTDAANPKIAFTDRGIAIIAGDVKAVLKEGVEVGGLVEGSISVSVPKLADVDPADKLARVLKNVDFTAELAGAIHRADPIRGTLTV